MRFKNPFKKNKQLRELRALSASFAILDEFERRGILHYHRSKPDGVTARHSVTLAQARTPSSGSLLIEESLATLKLAEGEQGFRKFLEQVAQWQNYRLLQEAYEAHRIDTEAKAVREAKKQYANLSKADVERIRQNARDNLTTLEPQNLITEFDLFIIRATAPSAEEALKEASSREGQVGALLALGHYDGKKLEMALYDDIKHNLQKEE